MQSDSVRALGVVHAGLSVFVSNLHCNEMSSRMRDAIVYRDY